MLDETRLRTAAGRRCAGAPFGTAGFGLAALALFVLAAVAGAETVPVPEAAATVSTGSPPAWESWQSGFVTTPDGVAIHYFETGPGLAADAATPAAAARPTLLFVPGLTMPGQIWAPQVEHFARTHRVVAMDPRSQGRSDRTDDGHYPDARGRDVKAVIDELGLAPVVPVCWSLAVSECVAMVDRFGTADLAGLVLVDGLAGGDYDPDVAPAMIAWTGRMMRDRETLTAGFVRSMYRTPQSPDYLDQVTRWAMQTPTDAIAALLVGGITNDNRAALAKIDRPVLFTVTRSPYLAAYEEMRDRMPDVRFEVFDAGHALFVDQPETFNRLVEELLEELAAGSREAGDGGSESEPPPTGGAS